MARYSFVVLKVPFIAYQQSWRSVKDVQICRHINIEIAADLASVYRFLWSDQKKDKR